MTAMARLLVNRVITLRLCLVQFNLHVDSWLAVMGPFGTLCRNNHADPSPKPGFGIVSRRSYIKTGFSAVPLLKVVWVAENPKL